jgi:predicted nucleotidyltransferase
MIKGQNIIVQLLDVLHPGIKIYLFGSRARKTNRPTSDIDLALDVGRVLSLTEMGPMRNIIDALNIPQKVDIVDMNAIPQDLKDIILKKGIAWKS